jgi:toxin ParE1/3/4
MIRLVDAAETDYLDIIRVSAKDFGALQAATYSETIALAIGTLGDEGTAAIGVKPRDEIGAGIFTLHVSRFGRKASHFLVFRVVSDKVIEILRILHERMDLARHISSSEAPPNH